MTRTMDEKIEAMEKELARANTIRRIYNEVKENMHNVSGRIYRNPETEEWEYHEFTDAELETQQSVNPFTGEVGYIWDSKEEVKELVDIYNEVLEFLVKLA